MADAPLAHLIAEAVNLAGGSLCIAGHDWQTVGGRRCPHDTDACSQAVYQCARCGTYDYGEPGGPGFDDCQHGGCSSEARAIVESRARPLAEYHEDYGPVVWWSFPIEEAAWIGSPGDSDWPGYHTHWTPHPAIPEVP